jgi:DNA (cytosine-5)-methyltransferase 1
MVGIEVFSGAGGMSVGARLAGIEIKLAIEIDQHAAYTYSLNHKNTTVLNKDIRKIRSLDINAGKHSTILFGGPPCQGFSLSNQKTRNIENENNWLFSEYMRIARLWKPEWVVLENVSGLLLTEQGFFLDKILQKLKTLGYSTNFKLLNASDYGVPQRRERLFIVGNLHGVDFTFPKPIGKKITVKEALSDLPKLENGSLEYELPYKKNKVSSYAKKMRGGLRSSKNHYVTKNSELVLNRYQHIPQGGNWSSIPERLLRNYTDFTRCHGGIYHRLKENEPSVVIGNYRKNMLIHPREHRGLSVREAARLQSFPDSFEFFGYLTHQQQQVGNAVPPMLAKAVFDKIITHL